MLNLQILLITALEFEPALMLDMLTSGQQRG